MNNKIPAYHFCQTISVNVDNAKLSDSDFRQFIRNTLPIVDFPLPDKRQTDPNPSGVNNDDPDGDAPMECPNKGRYIR